MSTMNTPEPYPATPPPFAGQSPFDDLDADVILRSSDNHDFRVYRAVLSLASPFFKDMFTLPQSGSESEIPVLPMQESGLVLDRMLRFWYPGAEPKVETLDQLREVLEVLISKYDVRSVVPLGKKYLREYIEAHPVAVFAVACHHGWEDVARAAAKESLKFPLRVLNYDAPEVLNNLPANLYHSLLQYHYLCGTAAQGITQDLRWIDAGDWVWFNCSNNGYCPAHALHWYLSGDVVHAVRVWFTDYLEAVGKGLAATPAADMKDPKWMSDAMKKIWKCSTCREKAFDQLLQFVSERLIPKIQREVEKIYNGLRVSSFVVSVNPHRCRLTACVFRFTMACGFPAPGPSSPGPTPIDCLHV
ncbi:hypothetical protein B0H10DRAFT_2185849 [Mycena sp. CBHHK59/15]|nr:hypothetical protein B0H10DRAFT_2185849 [Mycena sp. CBHHK59/15]